MTGPLPLIFDIHRFSLDDGPGIRTTVFLKGCPLACVWCHNPEAIGAGRELACHPDLCIRCGACVDACRESAVTVAPALQFDRDRCTVCGSCAEACPTSAIRLLGKAYPLPELLELLLRDRHFYEASGGGVTFSGGEPTAGMAYLGNALQALKEEGVHTAVQTCGLFAYDDFARRVLPFIDLIMFDLKFMAAAAHRRYTGLDNQVILDNFRRLTGEAGNRIRPRVPLVPGITATPDNLQGIASFLADLGYRHCDLLPYNPAGTTKRQAIGMGLATGLPELPLSPQKDAELRQMFQERLDQRIDTAA